ncbi:TrbI/VirB10 family protein [uncultured Thiodictyon sp.]|uniref:TrbI/VirB10 family protein n=1 Tax=uncultured Thiodictyon sp. TaxID=1846217 RepID=UPI0025FFE37B|nr:TrbI/VirB10 family protein [uncultured Thiodictyon sp.]
MAINSSSMSPSASPGSTASPGVRSVNNVPMWVGLGLAVMFFTIIAMVAYNRGAPKNPPPAAAEEAPNASAITKNIPGMLNQGGIIKPAAQPAPPPVGQPFGTPRGPTAPGTTPVPAPTVPSSVPAPRAPSPAEQELDKIEQNRIQQLVQSAKAKTAVPVTQGTGAPPGTRSPEPRSPLGVLGSPAAGTLDPEQAYRARVAQIQASGARGAVGALPGGGGGGGGGGSLAQFDNAGDRDRWVLNKRPEQPRSRYEVRAGFVLPALLMSGINSDLPGQILAQVSENVYDTPTGKYLLIPQGARLVGTYSSQVAYGQSRVLIAWQRIVFPDGTAMDVGAQPGVDGSGYAGFTDKVNNHYVRLFGSAIMLSAVTAGIAYSQPAQTTGTTGATTQQSFSSAMSQALGQQLGQVTGQLLSKNMSISPTLEIRPGYRFNVMLTKDLTFDKPYQSSVY